MSKYKIPFDSKGNHISYCDSYAIETEKENYEFDAVLKYNGFSRGRSSLNIEWIGEDEKTFVSGMGLLDSVLKGDVTLNCKTEIKGLTFTIEGKFTFKKQGTAVLLTLAENG